MQIPSFFRSRYVLHLEAEVQRLKEELQEAHEERRGAVNSLLAAHGAIPIEIRSRTPHNATPPAGKGMILPSTFRRQREAEDRRAAAQREEKPNA